MRRPFSPSLVLLPALLAIAVATACSSENHDDLTTPATGGSGGASGACHQDKDCPASVPVCDALGGKCVECLFSTQCADGERCSGNACMPLVGCTSSLDCTSHPPTTICDPSSSTCVQCVDAVDCPGTADCIDNSCMPYEACTTSLDCTQGLVCDPSRGRCVQCVTEADCGDGQMCIANECKVLTPCASDNQCTPLGKLCDKALGYCVDCLNNDQCPDAYHCELGACALDTCQAGAVSCQGNAQATCNASGDGWGSLTPCPNNTTCKPSQGCVPWVCTPGMITCQSDLLTTCSADGLSVLDSVNCAAQGLHCVNGACLDMACAPNQMYCDGNAIRRCNADGSASSLVQTCGANQYCDPVTTACVSSLCAPGAPVCNGAVATTCNAAGTGYVAGGTDCAAQGKSCSNGACVGCQPGGGPPTQVRLAEVFIGTNDYIVLENRGSCDAQLDSLSLHVAASEAGNDIEINIPAQVLPAGARVYVIDSTGALAGDISSTDNIFLTPDSGGYVLLCEGPCSSGNAIDYFAHASGAQPPLPPLGITFTPGPLMGVTTATQDTQSYIRVQYSGAFPGFKASDWQVGTATRPYENSTECPSTQPVQGSSCAGGAVACSYGAVTCICMTMWLCQ